MNKIITLILYLLFVFTAGVIAIMPNLRYLHDRTLTNILDRQFNEIDE